MMTSQFMHWRVYLLLLSSKHFLMRFVCCCLDRGPTYIIVCVCLMMTSQSFLKCLSVVFTISEACVHCCLHSLFWRVSKSGQDSRYHRSPNSAKRPGLPFTTEYRILTPRTPFTAESQIPKRAQDSAYHRVSNPENWPGLYFSQSIKIQDSEFRSLFQKVWWLGTAMKNTCST